MAPNTLLRGGSVVTPEGTIGQADVLLADGLIASVGPDIEVPDGAVRWEASGMTLAPGFIDVHVHGGGGFSLITTDADKIRDYARWVARHGVTSFLATICADSIESGIACVKAAAKVVGTIERGATLLGLNLEGPFVSPARPGALPAAWLAQPDPQLLAQLLAAGDGTIRMMTVAPELAGAEALIETLLNSNVVVAIGHTDAKYDQARTAFELGASHVTHAFNAMRPMHHRDPGVIGAALESADVTVEVIADGVHLHPVTVRMLVRSIGPERVCLVTDAVRPAGLESGIFRVGGHDAVLDGGSVRLPDGTIAGSAATMDGILRNLVDWAVAPLTEAVRMASTTPAQRLGLGEAKGVIAPGYDADIIALDGDLNVAATWIRGERVYEGGDIIPPQEASE